VLSETEYENVSVDTTDYVLMKMYLLESIKDFSVQNDLAAGELNFNGDIDALDFAVFKKYLIFLKDRIL
jgi:hypothetical protein